MNAIEVSESVYTNYIYFWSGQLFSLLGSSIVQFVIIWWITVVTGDPLYISLAAFLGFGSTIAVSAVSGVLVDRWDRKKVLMYMDGLQALSTLIMVYLFMIDTASIIHILILLTFRGVFQGFHQTASMAIIPIMVPKDKLRKINSWTYLFNGVIFLIGPVIGAITLEFLGLENMGYILLIDGVTFLVALVPLAMIKIPKIKSKIVDKKTGFKEEFKEGLHIIRERKGLMPLMLVFTAANLFLTPLYVLLPYINVYSALRGDAMTLSIALAMQSGGGIIISLILSKKKLFKNNTLGVAVGLGLGYVLVILVSISVIQSSLILFYGLMFFNGITIPIANIHSQEIWQTAVPAELQGRAFSVRITVAQITGPISMGLTGIFAVMIGAINLIIWASILGLLFNIIIWFFTSLPETEKLLENYRIDSSDK